MRKAARSGLQQPPVPLDFPKRFSTGGNRSGAPLGSLPPLDFQEVLAVEDVSSCPDMQHTGACRVSEFAGDAKGLANGGWLNNSMANGSWFACNYVRLRAAYTPAAVALPEQH